MKRVFVAASVLSIVVGSLAFTPKQNNFCRYQKNVSGSQCVLNARPQSFIETGAGNQFITGEDASGNCPTTTLLSNCTKAYSIVVE